MGPLKIEELADKFFTEFKMAYSAGRPRANNLQNLTYISNDLGAGQAYIQVYRRVLAKYTKELKKMGYLVAPNGDLIVKNVSDQLQPESR